VETDNTLYTVPLVHRNRAFVGSTDKHLYVLDLHETRLIKKINLASKIFCPPRLIDGAMYVGDCSRRIYRLDPDLCTLTGIHQLPDAITNATTCSPDGNMFYATTYVNEIFALRQQFGKYSEEQNLPTETDSKIQSSNPSIYAN